MNTKKTLLAMVGIVFLGATSGCRTTALSLTDEIKAPAFRVNAWQQSHPYMSTPRDRNWETGTWYTGVMAMYKVTGDQYYKDQALNWGKKHKWEVGVEWGGANKQFCSQTWCELYFEDGGKEKLQPTIDFLKTTGKNSPSGTKVWYMEGGRRYADSLYGAPNLAMLAKATGDAKYLDWMEAFFWDVHDELYDTDDHLFYRDIRFRGKKTDNGKKILWSRGNGWVMGGIVRVLEYLPKDDPRRGRYETLLQEMSASLIARQGEDGLWRTNLDDPLQFANQETSGTGFFVYAMAWGVNNGVLDRKTYLPVIAKGWNGLMANISPVGKVQYGQRVDCQPHAATASDSHEYVTGTFLLAASEMLKLKK